MFLYSGALAVTILCAAPSAASAVNDPIPPIDSCGGMNSSDIGFCSGAHDDAVTISANHRRKQQTTPSRPNEDSSTVNSQRSRETAEGSASSDAQAAGTRYVCDGVTREYSLPDGTAKKLGCLFSSARSGDDTAGVVPTTSEILYYAATTIHADGAGINKQPPTVSYTNRFVPTIVSVTNPTQTHVINLLGRDITITLTATNYEYSWGDGTPNTVTTSPGLAWERGIDPNNDPRLIRHYYTPPQGCELPPVSWTSKLKSWEWEAFHVCGSAVEA